MNYIELINNFWRFYDENKDKITPSEIVLYKVLLRYCNKIGWVNPFTINPYIMHEINPLSVNTYYKSFKRLNDIGLIKWVKGKHNVSNQSVTILNINTSINISLNNSIDTSLKFSLVNSPTNSLVNNNKTIIPLNQETIKLLKKDDFDLLISSEEFKNYIKLSGLKIENISDKFDFKKSLIDLGVEKQILDDWMEVRKKKKATNTKTSYTKIENQIKLSGLMANECIKIAVEKDWKGFEAKWLNNSNGQSQYTITPNIENDPNKMKW